MTPSARSLLQREVATAYAHFRDMDRPPEAITAGMLDGWCAWDARLTGPKRLDVIGHTLGTIKTEEQAREMGVTCG